MNDFDKAHTFFPSWHGKFEQLTSGLFEGTLRVVQCQLVRIVQVEANQRISLHGRDSAGVYSFYPVTPGNAQSLWHGRRLSVGQLVVHAANTETNHLTSKQTESKGLSIRPEELAEAARLLQGMERLPQSWTILSPTPSQFNGFYRSMANLLDRGLTDETLLGTAEGRMLEQECIRSLVAALEPSTTVAENLSNRGRVSLVGRAEDFMRSRLADPVGAIDLCQELGVSDRTLRLAFREHYGLGPMVYYRCLRLNAVRTLLKASPHLTVAEVARAFGFHHLGNFAADYRKLFGYRPSVIEKTL